MNPARRIGLLMVCTAVALPMISTAQPAAANHHGCHTYPYTPYMANLKTEEVRAANTAECAQTMQIVRSHVEAHLWSSRTGEWTEVSANLAVQSNAKSIYAEAKTSCAGLGDDVRYTSYGKAWGTWKMGVIDETPWDRSDYYAVFDCSHPLKNINP